MQDQLHRIIKLLNLAERLKFEMRHCWLSNGRRESVAEHVWRVSLMAMLFASYLQKKVDLEKTLKMIIIHDLVEAEAGDVPIFEAEIPERKHQKEKDELAAIEHIREILGDATGDEIHALWHEFEAKETNESKFAQAMDKFEAQMQHNEADINTWLDLEKVRVFHDKLEPYCDFDPLIKQFKDLIHNQAIDKMKSAGLDIEALKKQARVS